MDRLGIEHLTVGRPGRRRGCLRVDDPDSGRGQVEQRVELRQVAADVADRKRELRLGQLAQHS
jgi:hypothetical protein